MSGIVDWGALRRLFLLGTRRIEAERSDFWESRASSFYQFTKELTELTRYQLDKLELTPDETVLDVGAGCGRLTIPIARRVQRVTALDFSKRMLVSLKERAETEGVGNISIIIKPLEEVVVGRDVLPHDVVVVSFSLLMADIGNQLKKIDALARKRAYLFVSASPWMDKELQNRIFGRTITLDSDLICVYNILYGLGIIANVDIWEYESRQTYTSLEDAVTRFSESYGLRREIEDLVRGYLKDTLVEINGGFLLKQRKRLATLWWKKNEGI